MGLIRLCANADLPADPTNGPVDEVFRCRLIYSDALEWRTDVSEHSAGAMAAVRSRQTELRFFTAALH